MHGTCIEIIKKPTLNQFTFIINAKVIYFGIFRSSTASYLKLTSFMLFLSQIFVIISRFYHT
jgi:hypothetical protein